MKETLSRMGSFANQPVIFTEGKPFSLFFRRQVVLEGFVIP